MKLTKKQEAGSGELKRLREAVSRSTIELKQKNRELTIEAALERIRRVAMSMKKPGDMLDVCRVISTELHALGIKEIRNIQTAIIDEEKSIYLNYEYFRLHKKKIITAVEYKKQKDVNAFARRMLKDPEGFFTKTFKGAELKDWMKYQAKAGQYVDPHIKKIKSLHYYFYSIGPGGLGISTYAPLNKEEISLFKRFRNVFQLAYQRFIDIKKAEKQAREAQIEVAVERVRAKALAMYRSEEISSVVASMQKELTTLNIEGVTAATITLKQEDDSIRYWDFTALNAEDDFQLKTDTVIHPNKTDPDLYIWRIWNTPEKYFVVEQNAEDLARTVQWVRTYDEAGADNVQRLMTQYKIKHGWHPTVQLEYGKLNIDLIEPPTAELEQILPKMGAAFDLAYKRFLDLQKAEAQAREAQIEASLEKVRSRSLAMHKTDELGEVITVIVEKLKELNFSVKDGVALITYIEGSKDLLEWMENPGFPSAIKFYLPYFEHPVLSNLWKAKKEGKDFAATRYTAEENRSFLDHIFEHSDYKHTPQPIKDFCLAANSYANYIAFQRHTSIFINDYSERPLTEQEIDILKRFSKVFEQAYIRFLDLQKAEAQAREAKIEASLERVRAKAMAMHKSDDLHAAVAVVFEELEKLNLGVLRVGISVLDKEKRTGDVWVTSTDQGSAVQVSGDESFEIHPLLHGAFEAWLKQEDFYYVLEGADLTNYYKAVREAQFKLPESQMLSSETGFKTQYCFVAVYNSGGLFAFRESAFSDEARKVMRRFASVFDLTYKRFLDLQKAEALAQQAEMDLVKLKEEKKRTEEALTELKATQVQLIQSEKMASLGELTAGIAHEIQNPLNFVNNFSDVSNELLQEMKTELEKGNKDDAIAIANDVRQNLEKILHHGKRADGIVKSMLQHSRSSSGKKELTDINNLADEYLRLSFHGLRAKDKSFQAKFETSFDPNVEKLNIIPQEIGRVILNLVNNAFYAVSEKKKQVGDGFEPTVIVSTRKLNGKIEVRVSDNGVGMPQVVVDKIFQPFFTTKPTGQGTGLGLSLSFDIITKSHGGELKVETKEGERTEFIILLPNNN